MSKRKRGVSGNPARASWQPMKQLPLEEVVRIRHELIQKGTDTDLPREIWRNDRYECRVRKNDAGFIWLSIKRLDQRAIHDWRHLQQIKNEVLGPEREAAELYPKQSRVADSSTQFHLWALPEGMEFPFGFPDRLVLTPEEAAERDPGAKQRPFEEGLTI